MAPKFQIKVFQLSKFVKNLTIISVVTLSFLLVFFSKTDYYLINGVKNLSSSVMAALLSLFVTQTNTNQKITINDISRIDSLLGEKVEYIEKEIIHQILKTQEKCGIKKI